MSHANLNNALENNAGLRSKFSSHLNLLQTGGNGMTMAQSNIFDQPFVFEWQTRHWRSDIAVSKPLKNVGTFVCVTI